MNNKFRMKQIAHICILTIGMLNLCQSPKNLNQLLNSEYEQKIISSGDNFPKISLFENDRDKFLIGLHNGFDKIELKENLGWTDDELNEEISVLIENGFLQLRDNKPVPSICIIMQEEGQKMFQQSESVANKIVESLTEIEPQIKELFNEMKASEFVKYSDFKFFLFSDVLLDNWQINNVEESFLQKQRTLRHGKRYYLKIAEKDTASKIEVFGIYGNQYNCKDSTCFITYGNNRLNNKLSFNQLSEIDIPFISISDQVILEKMAELYKPKLIDTLNKHRELFFNNYNISVYKNELSFEEYFIWYYHFLYTKATDILNEREVIEIPENGIYRVQLER